MVRQPTSPGPASGPGRGRRSSGSGSQAKQLALAVAFLLVPWVHAASAVADPPVVANQHHTLDRPSSSEEGQQGHVYGGRQQQDHGRYHEDHIQHDIDSDEHHFPHVAWTEPIDDIAPDTPYIAHEKNHAPSSRKHLQHAASIVPENKHSDNYNNHNRKKNIPSDASALATLAPGHPVRAPNPPRHHRPRSVDASGLSSPQVARSLEDWEVEDFVLLATVDGDLFASDRRTGSELWRLEVDQPMIETKHHRANTSILDEDYQPIDHYIWAVEPNRDGGLYVMIPDAGAGLMKTSFTMKRLVEELSPFADEEPPVVYTGDKKTTLITLDAATGRVLKWFGSSGSLINQAESCLRPDTLYNMDSTECSSTGTITLGRTEYTVGIQRRDGRPIATLKYAEWGPNNYDKDLYHQYHTSLDNRYITSQHDGKVYAFDYNHALAPSSPKFRQKFPAPVARVFDVCRPWDAPSDSNPELVVLPQPPMPSQDTETARMRSNSVFLNHTESGSWYAMSGRIYPLILDAPVAQVSRDDWLDFAYQGMTTGTSRTLVGTHFLDSLSTSGSERATLPAGYIDRGIDDFDNNDSYYHELLPAEPQDVGFIDRVKLLPQSAANSIIDFISNPTLILIFAVLLIYNGQKLRRSYQHFRAKEFLQSLLESRAKAKAHLGPASETAVDERVELDSPDYPRVDANEDDDKAVEPLTSAGEVPAAIVDDEVPPASQPATAQAIPEQVAPTPDGEADSLVSPEKKKKAHRGRRGGIKHKKGKDKGKDVSPPGEPDATDKLDQEVKNIISHGGELRQKGVEPDVQIMQPNDIQAIGGSMVKMGGFEVDTAMQLGSGSNGTLVFAGRFDGREVAVKRMLIHFYDIASQETRLLRESDDHPNVIRYYSQQIQNGFLYIALERCAASLAEVVEKPSAFKQLADAGKQNTPSILYQITNGICHLHSLRIVHRDLKPQNILVNMGKDGRPRMLVSDFGLCKKLEDSQSSFGATTGRAAGTSGWRAPELLVDDGSEGPLQGVLDMDTTNSGSGSVLVNDALAPGTRRATRAIDIFSLGLVFFYVLTNGLHPFDCGDRYMREVNIRNDQFSLRPLDALGDYAHEAKDLITSMLRHNPKLRPSAVEIMSHPFFWSPKKRLAFLCDVSDHFEKECRDPPSSALQELEQYTHVTKGDFLRALPREFVDSMGKQRKYTGSRVLDLLRALRNKRNHYEDMSPSLKRQVGPLPEGYLTFWTCRFPELLLVCWNVVYEVRWDDTDRFREYYTPAGP